MRGTLPRWPHLPKEHNSLLGQIRGLEVIKIKR